MKLYLFAALLILGGIGCLARPERAAAGVFALLIGLAIIAYKVIEHVKRQKSLEEIDETMRQIEVRNRQTAIAREEWEREEMTQRQKADAWKSVQDKWQVIMLEHDRLLNEIGVAYTIANNLKLPDSPQMQHVVELCKKDIALASMYRQAQEEMQQVRIKNGWAEAEQTQRIPAFPTFKRLAIIYEKQKDYDNAIAVCRNAIELGYMDDGTDGQMPGRIARLMRKSGNDKKKIPAAVEVETTYSREASDRS